MNYKGARTSKLMQRLAVTQAAISMVSLLSLTFPVTAFATQVNTLPNLEVKKVLVGAPENVHYADFSFTYDKQGAGAPVTTAFEADGQNDVVVQTGAYDVTEVNPGANYTVTYSSNQNGHANDCNNLSAGNDQQTSQHGPVICTITNTYTGGEGNGDGDGGGEPQTCSFVSDTSTMVDAGNAVLSFVHPNWTHGLDASGAKWIWNAAFATPSNDTDEVVTFTKTFNVVGTPSSVLLNLAADNYYTVSVNGTPVPSCSDTSNLDNFSSVEPQCDITSLVNTGNNTLTFTVTNAKGFGTDPEFNPGGLIYSVDITGASCGDVIPTPPGTLKVHILKYLTNGETETPVAADSGAPSFPMNASWSDNGGIGAGSGDYTLSAAGWGGSGAYAADTSAMNAPADYSTHEVPNGETVLAPDATCQPGAYRLVGYQTGDTLGAALNSSITTTVPNFTGLTSDKYVVVVNEQCGEEQPAPSCDIVSDTLTNQGDHAAVLVSTISSFWNAIITGASWIWGEDPATPPVAKSETFTRTFTLDAVPSYAQIDIAADDGYVVKVNGTQIGADDGTTSVNFTTAGQDWYPLTNLVAGTNTLEVIGTNVDWGPGSNPAGLLYKIHTDGANCIKGDDNGGGDNNHTGTLTVIKHTIGGDGSFDFNVHQDEGEGSHSFTIETSEGSGQHEIQLETGDGAASEYDLTETVPEGWNLDSVSCVSNNDSELGNSFEDIENGQFFNLHEGDHVTCTFTNSKAGDTAETIVVHPADLATSFGDVISDVTKWFFYNDNDDTINNAIGSMVNGPTGQPLGVGSANINLDTTYTRTDLATYQFKNTKLVDIKTLKFSAYSNNSGVAGPNESPYLVFNLSFDGTDTWQKRLVYVPANNGSVPQNAWNTYDAINSGNALWVYSGATWPAPIGGAGSTPHSWSDILAAYPNAQLRATDSFMGVRVGEPGPDGYTGDIDAFVIGIKSGSNTDTKTFDFEPTEGNAHNPQTFSSSSGGGGGGGEVAGESTSTPEVLGEACGVYMDKFLRFGSSKNDADQTKKLQEFLNKWMDSGLPVTGFFGKLTEAAVKSFQTKYASDILTPWGLTVPTGIAYYTTLYEINKLECPSLTQSLPELVPWSANPNVQ